VPCDKRAVENTTAGRTGFLKRSAMEDRRRRDGPVAAGIDEGVPRVALFVPVDAYDASRCFPKRLFACPAYHVAIGVTIVTPIVTWHCWLISGASDGRRRSRRNKLYLLGIQKHARHVAPAHHVAVDVTIVTSVVTCVAA
jgi:hypothetical protein